MKLAFYEVVANNVEIAFEAIVQVVNQPGETRSGILSSVTVEDFIKVSVGKMKIINLRIGEDHLYQFINKVTKTVSVFVHILSILC